MEGSGGGATTLTISGLSNGSLATGLFETISSSLKVMERMISQNEELEKYDDYKNMYTEFWYLKMEYFNTLH